MNRDLPDIQAMQYASATLPLGAQAAAQLNPLWAERDAVRAEGNHLLAQLREAGFTKPARNPLLQPKEPPMPAPSRRLVKVIIVDPNDNIPLDQCLLHSSDEKLTDATDQELFYEIDIKTLLAGHNERRTKVRDKAVKERTEYLEPAKIRDLKMVVVTIATF